LANKDFKECASLLSPVGNDTEEAGLIFPDIAGIFTDEQLLL